MCVTLPGAPNSDKTIKTIKNYKHVLQRIQPVCGTLISMGSPSSLTEPGFKGSLEGANHITRRMVFQRVGALPESHQMGLLSRWDPPTGPDKMGRF